MSEYLRRFIARIETGRANPEDQYLTIIGHNEDKLSTPVTSMTVDQIIAESDRWRKMFGTTSGAAGAYQIIKPTLMQLKKDLKLTGDEKFTPELQDRMCTRLLEKRGLAAYLRGDLLRTEFGNNLAREWASMPLLSAQKRKDVVLRRGQSYYDGVAGNSALVTPGPFEAALDATKRDERPPRTTAAPANPVPAAPDTPAPAPIPGYTIEPAPIPEPVPTNPLGWIIVVVVLLVLLGIFLFVRS